MKAGYSLRGITTCGWDPWLKFGDTVVKIISGGPRSNLKDTVIKIILRGPVGCQPASLLYYDVDAI